MASRHKDWALDTLADRFTNAPSRDLYADRQPVPGRIFAEHQARYERGIPKIPFDGMVVRVYTRDGDAQSQHVAPGLLHGFLQYYRRGQPYKIAIAPELPTLWTDADHTAPFEISHYELVVLRVTDKHWQETTFALIEPGYCPPVALKRSATELFI